MEGEQPEEEPAPETRIEVEIPKVSTDLGSDLYFVKLPNFLSVEPRSELTLTVRYNIHTYCTR